MSDREQINVKLKSAKKERWEIYQNQNPEYSSMTDLIRQSVEKEIAGRHGNGSEGSSGKEIAEMKDMIRSLGDDIDTLSSVVSNLQSTVKTKPSDKHLRSEIFAALPASDSMKGPVTPQQLSEELGPVDESVVSNVLESMADDIGVIERIFTDDDRDETIRYRKTE